MPAAARLRLRIAGVYPDADAYPNVKYRLIKLRNSTQCDVHEVHEPWNTGRKSLFRNSAAQYAVLAWRLLYAQARLLWRWLRSPACDVAYLPYPAIPTAWVLSWLPRSLRPALVLDAFISWYDTAVNDRRMLASGGVLARCLWRIERRAYAAARAVVVDTQANAERMSAWFGLPAALFVPLRLAIDEQSFQPTSDAEARPGCGVLFIGTFVPLHGLETIAQAMLMLAERADIRFRIVGDGQSSPAFDRALAGGQAGQMEWIRQWQSSAALARFINEADLCLGIFGDGEKAARVWPFKNYLYMSCARTLITGDTPEARRLLDGAAEPAFHVVPCGDAQALADKIRGLADDPGERARCGAAARHLFGEQLSRASSSRQLEALLASVAASR